MKDVPGYEGLYAVTKGGKVWAYPKLGYRNAGRWRKGRFLKGQKTRGDYLYVTLYKGQKKRNFRINRLVALVHIPNPSNKPEVHHRDFNIWNNHYTNLVWCTSKENIGYSIEMGRHDS